MLPIQTILHPTDFSEPADYAFRLACSLARDHQARLVIVHVANPGYAYVGVAIPEPPLVQNEEDREETLDKLQTMKDTHRDIEIECYLAEGSAEDGILQAAKECSAGLIVMGTHGHTGFGRLLMGSVAESIVRKAPCSVLTVKTPQAETAKAKNIPDAASLAMVVDSHY